MLYSLYSVGLNNITSVLSKFETEIDIHSFCCIKNGFLFISKKDNIISKLNENRFFIEDWIKDGIKSPNAIEAKDNRCILIDENGAGIKWVEIEDRCVRKYGSDFLQKQLRSLFGRIGGDTHIYCSMGENNIYLSIDFLNKCFEIDENEIKRVIGSGRSGYGISNRLNNYLLDEPSGIFCIEDSVYICDKNNHVIRKMERDKIKTIGNPIQPNHKDGSFLECGMEKPMGIKFNKRMGYFIDRNNIRYLSNKNETIGTMLKVDNLVSIDVDDKNLYYLVKMVKNEKGSRNS